MNEKDKKGISKYLSFVLRHQPDVIGLELDENGWADVLDLMTKCAAKNMIFSVEDLQEIVATNDKKRFAFNSDQTKIRASQGHSIEVDLALTEKEPPEFLYHGTASSNLESIMSKGIEKRSIQHVHLSKDKETALKVGRRHGKPHILTVLSNQMYHDGVAFYLSENDVWLTDFVDKKYIRL